MQTAWTDCEDGEKKGKHTHGFAFDFANPKGPKRTKKETLEESCQAASQRKLVNGIKGLSWFSGLKYNNIINGMGIDYITVFCFVFANISLDSGLIQEKILTTK